MGLFRILGSKDFRIKDFWTFGLSDKGFSDKGARINYPQSHAVRWPADQHPTCKGNIMRAPVLWEHKTSSGRLEAST